MSYLHTHTHTVYVPSHRRLNVFFSFVDSTPDVKPSNVLINTLGQVKMCDFGISGHLVDSVAKTLDAGCKPYMAVRRGNISGTGLRRVWDRFIIIVIY